MKRHGFGFFMALLLSAALLSGCGAKSAGSYAVQNGMAVAETAAVSYDSAAMAAGARPSAHGVPSEMALAEEKGETTALEGESSLSGQTIPGRKLIRTVHLNAETETFDDLMEQLKRQIQEMNGYIEQSSQSGSSITKQNQKPYRYADLTVRIPSDKLDDFVKAVGETSIITYQSESTEDVTLRYSDLESRKKTLSVEQDRIWELLEKAATLESGIALEERLSAIRYRLESMESQLRLYDNQVEYSTLYISISEVAIYTPTEPLTIGQQISRGFTQNLSGMGTFLLDAFIWILTASPIWIPLFAVAAAMGYLIPKITKKHKTPGPKEPDGK